MQRSMRIFRKILQSSWLLYAALGLLLCGLLQWCCASDFIYAEQFRLFRWSADYVLPFFSRAGGIVGLLDSFTLQFFALPYGGAVLTTVLFLLMAVGTDQLLQTIAPRFPLPVFGIVIGLMQVGLSTEIFYPLEQTWAQIITVWALVPFARFRRFRSISAVAVSLLLYYATGIFAVFAIVLMAIIVGKDVKCHADPSDPRTSILAAPSVVWAALSCCLAIVIGLTWWTTRADAVHTWTLSAYYFSFAEASQHSYFVPAVMLLGVVAAIVLSDREIIRRPRTLYAAQIVCAVVLGGWYFLLCHGGLTTSRVKQLEVWRWQEQWQRILDEDMPTNSIPLYANYQNLALAATGRLADEFMDRGQCGTTGLQQIWQGAQQESDLLSDVFMQQGHVAMAQKMAFTAMQGNREQIHGRLMLRLIETNLILQADGVAEKYINILAQTLCYRERAEAYRRFVGHPELVTADPRLGELQRCTLGCDYCPNDLEGGLKQIIEANPSYRNALEYLGCFYMLNQNPEAFRNFLDTYHAFPGLHPLPQSFARAAQSLLWLKPGKEETR